MKKSLFLSLAVAACVSFGFAAAEVTEAAAEVEATEAAVVESVEAVEAETAEAVEVEAVEEAVEAEVADVVAVGSTDDGEIVYKKCVACHGAKAEKVYLNKIPALNTLEPVKMVEDMKLYKAGEMGENGTGQFKMGAVMKAQMASLSEEDMEAVVAYIQTLK